MGLAVSIILIAIGAILAFAVTATTQGLDITVVGVILMVVGIGGFLTSLILGDATRTAVPWHRIRRVTPRGDVRDEVIEIDSQD